MRRIVAICAILATCVSCDIGSLETPADFEDTLLVGNSELWVGTESLLSPSIRVICTDGTLHFYDKEANFKAEVSSPPDERDILFWRFDARCRSSGLDAGLELLRGSDLVEQVSETVRGPMVKLHGQRHGVYLESERHGAYLNSDWEPARIDEETLVQQWMHEWNVRSERKFRTLIDEVKAKLLFPPGMLILLDPGGRARYFANDARWRASDQIQYVVDGGSLDGLPKGPLEPDDGFLQKLAAAVRLRHNRLLEQRP